MSVTSLLNAASSIVPPMNTGFQRLEGCTEFHWWRPQMQVLNQNMQENVTDNPFSSYVKFTMWNIRSYTWQNTSSNHIWNSLSHNHCLPKMWPFPMLMTRLPSTHRCQWGVQMRCPGEKQEEWSHSSVPCSHGLRPTWRSTSHILKIGHWRASVEAQWLRICLPMQGTRVRALVWEDPTCHGATKPVHHNYWACESGAGAPQQERPR